MKYFQGLHVTAYRFKCYCTMHMSTHDNYSTICLLLVQVTHKTFPAHRGKFSYKSMKTEFMWGVRVAIVLFHIPFWKCYPAPCAVICHLSYWLLQCPTNSIRWSSMQRHISFLLTKKYTHYTAIHITLFLLGPALDLKFETYRDTYRVISAVFLTWTHPKFMSLKKFKYIGFNANTLTKLA